LVSGIQFGFNEDQQDALIKASVLHDIGKVGIPDSILMEMNELDILQVHTIQRHSEVGASIVEKLDLPQADKVAELVRLHHEREDGKGYPYGLAAEQIPVGAQIIAVVDVFDALTSHRSYRPAIGDAKAIELIEAEMGKQFNEDVVNAFKISYSHKGQNVFLV
jgi:HD-GYP domain-containing protein (c-di-GMP phosphodiesterase class II)